jgi:F420H(2)-dependent quinone reductase
MAIEGEYVPSPRTWVREQVETIEAKGTTRAVHIMNRPVVLLTMLGVSGKVRKVPLMRVEQEGVYAAVASQGGAPQHPKWYANLRKNPVIDLQDDTRTWTARAREIHGAEREEWWQRCVDAFPPYAEYQEKTDRLIPVLLLEPHPEDDAKSPAHRR